MESVLVLFFVLRIVFSFMKLCSVDLCMWSLFFCDPLRKPRLDPLI